MNGKKMAAFVLLVAILLGSVAATTPYMLDKLRLGLDLKGGFEILYEASPLDGEGSVDRNSLLETAKNLEKRIDAQGIAEPQITTEGSNRIRVRIAGVTDEAKVRETLQKPAELTFRAPDGTIKLRGSDFVPGGASIQYDQANRPMVAIKLHDADLFGKVTQELLGQSLAIYLDDKLISNPRVDEVIHSDSAVITGSFTLQEAKELRDTINLGALPLKLEEKYTQSVEASLGRRSLEMTVNAGLISLALIFLFMVLYYRVPGIVACVNLIVFTWLMLVVYWLLNATLTLPGIAAFILGVGMAVDANVITYERIKEEIRSGKSIMSGLRAGTKNSLSSIIDANLTTVIAAIVLYYFGTGAIQGFALTLILSIGVSFLTNVYLSRLLLSLLIGSGKFSKPSYYGVKEAEISAL